VKWKLRKPFVVILGAIMTLTTLSAASAANTNTTTPDSYDIVALGDSLTVGYEQKMTEKSIPYGYVDRLYEQALFHGRADISNYGIIGLTTPGLNQLLQGAAGGKKLKAADLQDFSPYPAAASVQADSVAAIAPEIATKLATADLVVMTIGGNDFGTFIKKVLKLPAETAKQSIQDEFDTTMNEYTTELNTTIRQLHELAPNAQIVLSDQYLPLWSTHALYPELLLAVDKLANHLDDVAEQFIQAGIPVKVAHISPAFKGKELSYTYVNGFDYDNHPKQQGYEVIAKAFAEVIWKSYLQPAPRAADVPLSVIVNGKELLSTPILKNDTTFIALREVATAVSADVEWIEKTKTAIFRKDGVEVAITIGADQLYVNGAAKDLRVPAYLAVIDNQKKTYVPLAAIADGLNYQVIYRSQLKTAFINP
jgi:lysophospholipase L1-like esterase